MILKISLLISPLTQGLNMTAWIAAKQRDQAMYGWLVAHGWIAEIWISEGNYAYVNNSRIRPLAADR